MYRIIKRTPEAVTNHAGQPDIDWKVRLYGEYFSHEEAQRVLDTMKMSKHDVSIEYRPTLAESVNTDYLD